MSNFRRRRRSRRKADIFDAERSRPNMASGFVDNDLTPEAQEAARTAQMSFIEDPGLRTISVFLRTKDHDDFSQCLTSLLADMMQECLLEFVHANGGQVVLANRINDRGQVVTPNVRSVRIEDDERGFIRDGHVFIHFPNERVVVSAAESFPGEEMFVIVDVCSDSDSSSFFDRWEDFTVEHNFLKGRSLFADGELIQRERPYTWEDILLPDATMHTVQLHVESFLRNRQVLKDMGVKPRRGLLLSGPPGTGKTLLGKVLADNLESTFIWVSPRHITSPNSFARILETARFLSPAVLFLEDIDLFGEDREGKGGFALGELMNQLDGAIDNEDIVTIATTNRVEVVEKALRNRPGRFDRIIQFDAMDERCRRLMLDKLLSKAAISPEDMDYLVAASNGRTGARIAELANTIYMVSVDENAFESDNGSVRRVAANRELLDTALEEVQTDLKGGIGFNRP